jgi:hypothetical protein
MCMCMCVDGCRFVRMERRSLVDCLELLMCMCVCSFSFLHSPASSVCHPSRCFWVSACVAICVCLGVCVSACVWVSVCLRVTLSECVSVSVCGGECLCVEPVCRGVCRGVTLSRCVEV